MIILLFVLGGIAVSYAAVAVSATVLFFIGTVLGFRSTGVLLLLALTGFCVWICNLMQDTTSTVIVVIGYVIIGGATYFLMIFPARR